MSFVNLTVDMRGVRQTVRALKSVEPELAKRLRTKVRRILANTARSAKSRYGKGAWSISVLASGGRAQGLIGMISSAAGSSRGYASWADAPAGAKAAIFDNFGRRTSIAQMKTPQARATGESLEARYGRAQRFLWPAWLDNKDESEREIDSAIRELEKDLQREIDAAV